MFNSTEATLEFRERLLKVTLRHAINHVPLYKELYKELNSKNWLFKDIRLETLQSLPLLTKEYAQSRCFDALANDVSTSYIQFTSGTTGDPYIIHRSEDEANIINSFFKKVRVNNSTDSLQPIILSLANIVHGTPTPFPSTGFIINGACYDEGTAYNTTNLLTKDYDLKGFCINVEALSGPTAQLIYFTEYLKERGCSYTNFGIKIIYVYGDYLSSPYFRFLKDFWQVPIVNQYSLTEIFGGAKSIDMRPFEVDVHVIPEVIDKCGKPVKVGEIGELVLTSLYPFVQRHPFIRYKTGDLVLQVVTNDGPDKFYHKGRIKGALYSPIKSDELILTAGDILDVIDEYPIIWGKKYAENIPIKNKVVFKNSKFYGICEKYDDVRLTITLQLESTIPVDENFKFKNELEQIIRKSLLDKSDKLRKHIQQGAANFIVELLNPGELSSKSEKALDQWHFESNVFSQSAYL